MFSTKAAMNRFHTLPESPQVLIFYLNQFGCCRFRNISQLTNYWQLPHSVIWSHVGSSPNLRYWCLDQTVQEGANLNSHRGRQGSSCTVTDVVAKKTWALDVYGRDDSHTGRMQNANEYFLHWLLIKALQFFQFSS